ncbi:hypothetical protein [Nicoliella lavandulae]|uniref:Uncharacterized protein n=1 Tax=Nicoliella lavandulae TaxID=3082954 RepID=A0ABU8SM68_9LACO
MNIKKSLLSITMLSALIAPVALSSFNSEGIVANAAKHHKTKKHHKRAKKAKRTKKSKNENNNNIPSVSSSSNSTSNNSASSNSSTNSTTQIPPVSNYSSEAEWFLDNAPTINNIYGNTTAYSNGYNDSADHYTRSISSTQYNNKYYRLGWIISAVKHSVGSDTITSNESDGYTTSEYQNAIDTYQSGVNYINNHQDKIASGNSASLDNDGSLAGSNSSWDGL